MYSTKCCNTFSQNTWHMLVCCLPVLQIYVDSGQIAREYAEKDNAQLSIGVDLKNNSFQVTQLLLVLIFHNNKFIFQTFSQIPDL